MKKIYLIMLLILVIFYSCKEKENTSKITGMAYIPSGQFYMGSKGSGDKHGVDEGDGKVGLEVGVDEIPRHTVSLKGFYIDKYEVTMAQYKKFVDVTAHRIPDNPTHDYDSYIWKKGTYPPEMDNVPVVLVSYDDAVAYCKWVGKRLPTEEEWEKSCRGDDGRRWPWGNTFEIPKEVSKANTRELLITHSTAVGSFPIDVSPYGIYDMAGNVQEWTSSWYQRYPGSTLERDDSFGEQYKVIRGGSWLHPSVPESRCASRGFYTIDDRSHRSIGFRCAKDA